MQGRRVSRLCSPKLANIVLGAPKAVEGRFDGRPSGQLGSGVGKDGFRISINEPILFIAQHIWCIGLSTFGALGTLTSPENMSE